MVVAAECVYIDGGQVSMVLNAPVGTCVDIGGMLVSALVCGLRRSIEHDLRHHTSEGTQLCGLERLGTQDSTIETLRTKSHWHIDCGPTKRETQCEVSKGYWCAEFTPVNSPTPQHHLHDRSSRSAMRHPREPRQPPAFLRCAPCGSDLPSEAVTRICWCTSGRSVVRSCASIRALPSCVNWTGGLEWCAAPSDASEPRVATHTGEIKRRGISRLYTSFVIADKQATKKERPP